MSGIGDILAVGAGSCAGGVARFLAGRLVQAHVAGPFPLGTLAVNVAGCLAMGLIYGLAARGCHMGQWMRLFLTVGFCGGFTTFSTFMHDTQDMFGASQPWLPVLYMACSLSLGMGALYLGQLITR